jgi:hypothetical protein
MPQQTARRITGTTLGSKNYVERPANTTAYAAYDAVSDVTSNDHFLFLRTLIGPQYSGKLKGVDVKVNANVAALQPDLDLWLFDTDIAETADNSPMALSFTDVLKAVGIIPIPVSGWRVSNNGAGAAGSIIQTVSVDIPFTLSSAEKAGTQRLFGQLVMKNAYTPVASTRFHVTLLLEDDD